MKRSYLDRLSRAAKWMLPPEESEDVIADFREILAENPRTEEALCRDFGEPVEAVRLLSDEKEFRRWKIVFLILTVCALLPPLSIYTPLWIILHDHRVSIHILSLRVDFRVDFADLLFLAGMILSVCFWRGNRGNSHHTEKRTHAAKPLPKPARILLILFPLVAAGLALWQTFLFTFFDPQSLIVESGVLADGTPYEVHQNYLGYLFSAEDMAHYALPLISIWEALCWTGGGIAVCALLKARTENARWRAFYVLGLTVAYLCTSVYRFVTSLDIHSAIAREWYPFAATCAVILAVGMAGSIFCLRDGERRC